MSLINLKSKDWDLRHSIAGLAASTAQRAHTAALVAACRACSIGLCTGIMRTTSGSVRGTFSSAPLPVIIITEDFIWLESERHEELPAALGYNLMRHA